MGMHDKDQVVLIKRSEESFIRIMSERFDSDKLDEFSIPVKEVEEVETEVPKGESTATASLPASEFMTMCKEIFYLAPSLNISGTPTLPEDKEKSQPATEKQIRFEFNSGELARGTITYRKPKPNASRVYRIKVN
jgi:hypothetical protein